MCCTAEDPLVCVREKRDACPSAAAFYDSASKKRLRLPDTQDECLENLMSWDGVCPIPPLSTSCRGINRITPLTDDDDSCIMDYDCISGNCDHSICARR